MNKHRIRGKISQTTGKMKEKMGKTLNNQRLANSGIADQIKGAAKEVWGNTKEVVKQQAHVNAESTRREIEEKTQEAKNRANLKIQEFRKSA